MEAAINLLTVARTKLVMEQPFIGALALRMPLREARPDWCPNITTDARSIYYSAGWVMSMREPELRYAVAHIAMHCALGHFVRRAHRSPKRWDIASELAVNSMLLEAGMPPPKGIMLETRYQTLSAEEIYVLVDESYKKGQMIDTHLHSAPTGPEPERKQAEGELAEDEELDDPNSPARRPPQLSPAEEERLARQWKQRLAAAAQDALRSGRLGEHMRRLANRLMRPKLSWREILAPFLMSVARGDYSYERPSRREGEAILPRLRSRGSDVAVVLDTSGSIRKTELGEFIAEVNALKSVSGVNVTLHICDLKLADEGPWHFPTWEHMYLPDYLPGGGGTDFHPIFEWMDKENQHPDLLIYFTDMDGPCPSKVQDFPVLWVVKGPKPVPWGMRIQLN